MTEKRAPLAGFTLLEVLVALSILALTLAALLPIFSNVAGRTSALDDERTAIALAGSKLDAIGIDAPLADGVTEGKFDNGFAWNLDVSPYATGRDDARIDTKLVVLTVKWPNVNGPHQFVITGIRLTGRH